MGYVRGLLKRNASTLLVAFSFVFKMLCALIVLRVLAGGLGAKNFGLLTQYMTFLAIVFGLSLGGGGNFIIKKLSRADSDSVFKVEIGKMLMFGLLFSIFVGVIFYLSKPQLERFVFYREVSWCFLLYLWGLYILSSISVLVVGVSLAKQAYWGYFWSSVGSSFLYVLSVIISIKVSRGIEYVYWSLPLLYVFPVFFLYKNFFFGVFRGGGVKVDFGYFKEIFGYCFIVYAGLVSIPVTSIFVRNFFHGELGLHELSFWQVAVKLSDVIQQFYGVLFSVVLLPFLTRKIAVIGVYSWLKLLLIVSFSFLVVSVIVYPLRSQFIAVLFGSEYSSAEQYIKFYLIGDYFRICSLFCSFSMMAAGRFKISLLYEVAQGFFFALIYFCSDLSQFGVGVGYAYMITYMICCLMMLGYTVVFFNRDSR